MSNFDQADTDLQALCNWCDKPMLVSEAYKNFVCSNCYRMLSAAGLSDARIFENTADNKRTRELGSISKPAE